MEREKKTFWNMPVSLWSSICVGSIWKQGVTPWHWDASINQTKRLERVMRKNMLKYFLNIGFCFCFALLYLQYLAFFFLQQLFLQFKNKYQKRKRKNTNKKKMNKYNSTIFYILTLFFYFY